ncbi:GDP-mannose 4,6-dehydratase [Candidatus Woesearchaeota archaeon]|nr:GDP-mannose 4,6-dehydratase [Candidatus Woesearchaeota archaeon]
MNILLTGGAGFIGSHVASKLLKRGDNVVIIDNFNDYYDPKLKHDRIKSLIKSYPKVKVYSGDITNLKLLDSIFKKHNFEKVCHLAAQAGVRYSIENPFIYEHWNNLGTLNILELSVKHKIKNLVYASSSSVYGGNKKYPFSEKDNVDTPISLYAATKKCNELYAHTYNKIHGLKSTGLRFFTVYGPFGRPDMALFKFTKSILEDKPIDVYNKGNMIRDFTYVDDIADGVIKSIDKVHECEVFNLGNNKPVTLKYFISTIEKNLSKKAKKNLMGMQKGDVPKTYANINKAKKMLKWQPKTSIEDGIKNFIEWYKEYYKIQ